MVSLFRQILQNNPPIQVLNMREFSADKDRDVNIGELVLEILLSSNVHTITDLDLSGNSSWSKHPETGYDRSSNVDLLMELMSKQAEIHHLNLGGTEIINLGTLEQKFCNNGFSSIATQKIVTRIADHPSNSTRLQTLNLRGANFEIDETVEKLADILQSASQLKKCNILNQQGSRCVYVEIKYAIQEVVGSIRLLKNATDQEICKRVTTKTEALQKIMIEQKEDIELKREAILTM